MEIALKSFSKFATEVEKVARSITDKIRSENCGKNTPIADFRLASRIAMMSEILKVFINCYVQIFCQVFNYLNAGVLLLSQY